VTRKQKTDDAAPKLAPTHKIVTRAVAAERKRGHAAITPAPRKQRR
jgi:hypothetical protein